jgi:hypothetical protein
MGRRLIGGLVAILGLLALSAAAAAQDAGVQNPRTPEQQAARLAAQQREAKSWEPTPPPSDPRDFTGVWQVPNPVVTLRQTDGSLPPYTEAEAKDTQFHIDSERAGRVITDAATQCFPHGVPRLTTAPYPLRFAHAPGMILMLHEVAHNVRIIYMDKTAPPPNTPMSFLGYTVGHWDGNTLVAETTHLNNQTRLDGFTSHGPTLKVTERWTKVKTALGNTELEDVITIDDPDHFTRPWSTTRHFAFRSDVANTFGSDGLVEYSCEENNRNVPGADNIVTAK